MKTLRRTATVAVSTAALVIIAAQAFARDTGWDCPGC